MPNDELSQEPEAEVVESPSAEPVEQFQPAPKAPVPYDRFKEKNKEAKRWRKLAESLMPGKAAQAEPVAAAPVVSDEPSDPKLAESHRFIAKASAAGVKPQIDAVGQRLAALEAERNAEKADRFRKEFWEENPVDDDVRQSTEARYKDMTRQAKENGMVPQFSIEDIFNYELGVRARKTVAQSAAQKANSSAVNKAALGVVGAKPGAPKGAPKSLAEKSAAELASEMKDFEF